jgi:hypothetical protein
MQSYDGNLDGIDWAAFDQALWELGSFAGGEFVEDVFARFGVPEEAGFTEHHPACGCLFFLRYPTSAEAVQINARVVRANQEEYAYLAAGVCSLHPADFPPF